MAKQKQLRITQIKSTIGYREKTRQIIRSLGLGRIRKSVILPDNASVRGMIEKVPHLIDVEEVS
jgi:large subunit ribosomal protein L30